MHITIPPKKEFSYIEAISNLKRSLAENKEYRREVRAGRWHKDLYQEIREKHKKKQVKEQQMKNNKELKGLCKEFNKVSKEYMKCWKKLGKLMMKSTEKNMSEMITIQERVLKLTEQRSSIYDKLCKAQKKD
jgi:hypothetical protein